MKERPILFSTAMVQAILAGRKTQTRRLIRIDDTPISEDDYRALKNQRGIPRNAQNVRFLGYLKCDAPPGSATVSTRVWCPYGSIGDRLWVRESWSHDAPDLATCRAAHEDALPGLNYGPYYRATEIAPDTLKWRPSIHMPRWASRITLEVTGVRVERLQDITGDDVLAEGVDNGKSNKAQGMRWVNMQRMAFEKLWDEINGTRAPWSSNPWVWAVTFHRIKESA